jgi:ribose 5-phosphate isomerase B
MRIAVAADERVGVAATLLAELERRGHEPIAHGALAETERDDWAWASEAAARDVADGRAEQGIVCCWTGTGASIAANKVPGVRAALCNDLFTAMLSRQHNDANVLAMGGRIVAFGLADEIVALWLQTPFEGGRHQRRVDQITALEKSGPVTR